ncbi:MAG: TlpA family protein disulfide reductase [Acidimicrobiales bacterium]
MISPTHPADDVVEDDEAGRRRAIFGLVGGFLAVLVVIVVVQWITDSEDSAQEPTTLPALTFTTLEGETFALTDIGGQPAVINFFASWCAPCLAEMPDFEEVHQDTGDDVFFLGVNSRETDMAVARDVVDSTGVTYTILLGDDGGPGSLYQHLSPLGVMPTTAFVAADGTVVEVHSGVLNGEELRSRLSEHFG